MITEIRLERFGKFVSSRYRLDPVTVFIGDNESGKSTLFDAVFDCICAPKASTTPGKQLRDRYGEGRRAELVWDGAPLEIEPEEFVNLFAIRAGDIGLNLSPGRTWWEKVKAHLFSADLDPSAIVRELELEASERGGARHMKRLVALRQKRSGLETELKELAQTRKLMLEREKAVRQAEAGRASREGDLEAKARRREELDVELKQQRWIRERARCASILTSVAGWRGASEKLRALSAVSEDQSAAMEALRREAAEAEKRSAEAGASLTSAQSAAAEAGERITGRRAAVESAGRAATIAADLRRSLERDRPAPRTVVSRSLRKPLVVLAAVVLAVGAVAGLALLFARPGSLAFLVPLGVGVAAAGSIFAGAIQRTTTEDHTPLERQIARLKEEWVRRVEGAPELRVVSYEGMIGELAGYESAQQQAETSLDELTTDHARREAAAATARESVEQARRRQEQAKADLDGWLAERGVSSVEEYLTKRAEFEHRSQEYERMTRDLDQRVGEMGCASLEELPTECEIRIRALDERISAQELTAGEIGRREAELEELKAEIASLEVEGRKLLRRVAEDRGTIRGSLGDVPRRIVALEQRLETCDTQIRDVETHRRAAALALDIMRGMSEEEDELLEKLSGDICRSYGSILGEAREVVLSGLDVRKATVSDAGGAPRAFPGLSSGTQDAFLLAARISLASASREGPAVIVLDEPFRAVDRHRAANMLGMLREFQDRRGWQILIFSKEPYVETLCGRAFPEARVHHLPVGDERGG